MQSPIHIACVMVTQVFIDFQGFGMLLMEEAERIARDEHGSVKIAVISGRLTNSSPFFYKTGSDKYADDLILKNLL